MGYYNPGQQFIIRAQATAAGSDLTAVVSLKDLVTISGAYLTLTTATDTTHVVDTKLSSTNTYLGRIVEFTSAANATSAPNVGLRRVISGYVVASQTMTFAVALPATPQVGDGYKILSPVPRQCSKVALCNMGQKLNGAGASGIIGWTLQLTCADGYTWGATQPADLPSQNFSPPIEMDLVAHGELTCLFDMTTVTTTQDHYLVFAAS